MGEVTDSLETDLSFERALLLKCTGHFSASPRIEALLKTAAVIRQKLGVCQEIQKVQVVGYLYMNGEHNHLYPNDTTC